MEISRVVSAHLLDPAPAEEEGGAAMTGVGLDPDPEEVPALLSFSAQRRRGGES
jgi:hypothetical protein